MLFCVWSCVSCLRLYEVDDDADGDVDAVGDVVGDDKEAGDILIITINSNFSDSVLNTSGLIVSNIKISITSSIKSTMRMIVNRWQDQKAREANQ